MTLGNKYRDALAKNNNQKKVKQQRESDIATKNMSAWFNRIAAELPQRLEQTVTAMEKGERGPGLYWTYPGDFDHYRGNSFGTTKGYGKLDSVCEKLDVDFSCEIEDGYDITDSRIKELIVKIHPSRKYGALDPNAFRDFGR